MKHSLEVAKLRRELPDIIEDTSGGSGLIYVDRGDANANDFVLTDLTRDDGWHDLDLSVIVPAAAELVVMRWEITGSVINRYLYFRKNGYTDIYNNYYARTMVTGLGLPFFPAVPISTDGIVEYRASASGLSAAYGVVLGWWLPG